MACESKVQSVNTLTSTADLVRRDSRIPGLALMLDPERLLAALQTQMDINRVESIRLNYLRYKPGMNCLARYAIQAGGLAISAYAKAHGQDARIKADKSRERPVIDSTLGPGRIVLADQQVIFSTFPNDAKLTSLQRLGDAGYRQRLFDRMFGMQSEWAASALDEVLNYKPERRFVVRLKRPDGELATAKFYTRSGYAEAHSLSRKLNRALHGFCPDTLGRSKKYTVVAYRWLPGITLRQLATCGKLSRADLTATAAALAGLHAAAGDGLASPDAGTQLAHLGALADQLGIILPHLAKRTKSVTQSLSQWLGTEPQVRRPIHGDFYDKQAIVNAGQVKLIDLDAACLGNPLVDLGSYVAHLERQAGNHSMSASDVEMQRDTLIGAYERVTGSVRTEQLNRYTALGLFALIHQPFRDWSPDWPAQTELLLNRVETLLGS